VDTYLRPCPYSDCHVTYVHVHPSADVKPIASNASPVYAGRDSNPEVERRGLQRKERKR
jgi:hypothetical protein